MSIRLATCNDYKILCDIDSVAEIDGHRCEEIFNWIKSDSCHIYEKNDQAIGYGVLTHHFFGYPFIELIMVNKPFRQQGIGREIIEYFQSIYHSTKLFSSTNLSNQPMQNLFSRLSFKPSGSIDNLDEGDPEIIFCFSNMTQNS